MRIAIVTETWHPHVDGVVVRLSETIRCLLTDGHQVLVVAPRDGETGFPGVEVAEVPSFGVPFIHGGQAWGVPVADVGQHLDRFRPDVVHVVSPIMLGFAGVRAARRRGLPLVCSYHTDLVGFAVDNHLGFFGPVITGITRHLHRQAAINLATSAGACHRLRGIGVDHVHLWRRGIDLELFHHRRRATASRERLGGHPDRPLVVSVGRVSKEKRLHLLAPLAEDPGLDLAVVGDGPERESLEQLLDGQTVRFTGMLKGTDLADAYAAADVFVFTSTTEVNPLVLIEAMASGLPVLAADSSASRELLQAHPQARLFTPDEQPRLPALARELVEAHRAEPDPAAIRRTVEGWTWPAATRHLVEQYRAAGADGEQDASRHAS